MGFIVSPLKKHGVLIDSPSKMAEIFHGGFWTTGSWGWNPILQSGGGWWFGLYLRPVGCVDFLWGGSWGFIYIYIEFQWSLGFLCFRWWFFFADSITGFHHHVWISTTIWENNWVVHPFPSTAFESQNPRSGPEPSITNHLKPHPCLASLPSTARTPHG